MANPISSVEVNFRRARFDAPHQTLPLQEEIDYPAVAGTVVARNWIKQFKIPTSMPYRRLYVYKEVVRSVETADYVVDAELDFLKGGRSVGTIPIGVAQDDASTLLSRTMVNACVRVANDGAKDIIHVTLSRKFTQGLGQTFLAPHNFVMDAEEVAFSIKRARAVSATVQQVKFFIYLESSTHPF